MSRERCFWGSRSINSPSRRTELARFDAAGAPTLPTPALLREAFLWSQERAVTKTATVSLHGNQYEVDPVLVGRKIELISDPLDLTRIDVPLPAPARSAPRSHW